MFRDKIMRILDKFGIYIMIFGFVLCIGGIVYNSLPIDKYSYKIVTDGKEFAISRQVSYHKWKVIGDTYKNRIEAVNFAESVNANTRKEEDIRNRNWKEK